ncbi:nickel-dependent hydrogenase large subunit, partial [bacterium]|nr:nickel-dependent hydrogenase large subunit [bacterium]
IKIRQILLQLSAIHSHIRHFYWELLPDYLNKQHYDRFSAKDLSFFAGTSYKEKEEGDLSLDIGANIIKNVSEAANTLDVLQKVVALLAGKYPIIMNQIPGGLTNISISRTIGMKIVRKLEQIKQFIEVSWSQDVKSFIQNLPDTVVILEKNPNLISFGSLSANRFKGKSSHYSGGVLLDGKLEPVNEIKITESLVNTFFLPIEKSNTESSAPYDFNKKGGKTWIKGARYDSEIMVTGALPRMLVTQIGGGNLEISDRVGQMIDDLELSLESPNCVASRILAEVFEGRFYLKNIFKNLLDFDHQAETNKKTSFNFYGKGVGVGRVESPGGALMHQVFIDDNRITQYRIITPMNWNFSPADESGKTGIVEKELNRLSEMDDLSKTQIIRILHSYNAQALDGTQ